MGKSDLPLEEILTHRQGADAHGVEEGLDVEGAEEGVEEAEGHHARDVASGVLQRPALVRHAVSFGYSEWEVMLVPWAVYLLLQGSCFISPLIVHFASASLSGDLQEESK